MLRYFVELESAYSKKCIAACRTASCDSVHLPMCTAELGSRILADHLLTVGEVFPVDQEDNNDFYSDHKTPKELLARPLLIASPALCRSGPDSRLVWFCVW